MRVKLAISFVGDDIGAASSRAFLDVESSVVTIAPDAQLECWRRNILPFVRTHHFHRMVLSIPCYKKRKNLLFNVLLRIVLESKKCF